MGGSNMSPRDAEVDARYQSIAKRYGDRFDEAAEAKIRNDVGRQVDAAISLREWSLSNGDEPDFVFHPERRDS